MAGSKSTQTRLGIITFTIHPYACFSRLSCSYWWWPVGAILNLNLLCYRHVGEIHYAHMGWGIISFDRRITAWLVNSCTYLKSSVGLYSGCDNLICVLFDPAIPTSSFNLFNYFLYLLLLCFILVTLPGMICPFIAGLYRQWVKLRLCFHSLSCSYLL